jgi:hypothetical protein
MGDFTKEKSIAKHCGQSSLPSRSFDRRRSRELLTRKPARLVLLQRASARCAPDRSLQALLSLLTSAIPTQSFSTTREVKVKLAIKREPDIRSGP